MTSAEDERYIEPQTPITFIIHSSRGEIESPPLDTASPFSLDLNGKNQKERSEPMAQEEVKIYTSPT
jgi:hypothetical protein